jgi:hypothetical protein
VTKYPKQQNVVLVPKYTKETELMPWLCFDKGHQERKEIIKPPRTAREEVVSITNFMGMNLLTFINAEMQYPILKRLLKTQ